MASNKVLNEILNLKKRIEELSEEMKLLRSLLSKTTMKKYENRYKSGDRNRYWNRDKVRETRKKVHFNHDNVKRREKIHQENPNLDRPEPMEINVLKELKSINGEIKFENRTFTNKIVESKTKTNKAIGKLQNEKEQIEQTKIKNDKKKSQKCIPHCREY